MKAIFGRLAAILNREMSLRNRAGAIAQVINQQPAIAMRPPPRPPLTCYLPTTEAVEMGCFQKKLQKKPAYSYVI